MDNNYYENNIWADMQDIATNNGMTQEEYIKWIADNNPELDWGEDSGQEILS